MSRRPEIEDLLREAAPQVLLAEQDRSRWDQDLISEGVALIAAATARGSVGEYQL